MEASIAHIATFVVSEKHSCRKALELMNLNRKGFVLVVNEANKLKGTLTDGDVRRALLKGLNLDEAIGQSQIYTKGFTSLQSYQSIDDAIDIFKNGRISFLPIVDDKGILVNVLTKKQLYVLLLQCDSASLLSDFSNVDEDLIDFEVFNRPWGIYKTTILQNNYQSKVLQVRPGASLSLQYHHYREEFWTVAYGSGTVQVGDSVMPVQAGSMIFIPKGCKHRLNNTSTTEQLVVIEVQIGTYFGEDDIVRIEDKYNRI